MNLLKLIGGPLLDTAADLFKSYQEGKLTKEQLKFEIETLAERHDHEIAIEQIKTNREEAKNSSLFVSGARPFILWVCGLGFATNFLIAPFFTWGAQLAGHPAVFPMADLNVMLPVLGGLLGLGGLRTFEKAKGVARNSLEVKRR